MYEIEKGVEIPKKKHYPFRQMEVGDSFFVPCEPDVKSKNKTQVNIIASVRQKKFPDRKFVTHRELGGIRCWRVE